MVEEPQCAYYSASPPQAGVLAWPMASRAFCWQAGLLALVAWAWTRQVLVSSPSRVFWAGSGCESALPVHSSAQRHHHHQIHQLLRSAIDQARANHPRREVGELEPVELPRVVPDAGPVSLVLGEAEESREQVDSAEFAPG